MHEIIGETVNILNDDTNGLENIIMSADTSVNTSVVNTPVVNIPAVTTVTKNTEVQEAERQKLQAEKEYYESKTRSEEASQAQIKADEEARQKAESEKKHQDFLKSIESLKNAVAELRTSIKRSQDIIQTIKGYNITYIAKIEETKVSYNNAIEGTRTKEDTEAQSAAINLGRQGLTFSTYAVSTSVQIKAKWEKIRTDLATERDNNIAAYQTQIDANIARITDLENGIVDANSRIESSEKRIREAEAIQ